MAELAVAPSNLLHKRFLALYQDFNTLNLGDLSAVYSNDVVFKDPVHELHGLASVRGYFDNLGKNLTACRFEFQQQALAEGHGFIRWQMLYAHPRLAGGRELSLAGATYIEFNERVTLHQDYYDLGAMLYEQVPLLGAVVRRLKLGLQG